MKSLEGRRVRDQEGRTYIVVATHGEMAQCVPDDDSRQTLSIDMAELKLACSPEPLLRSIR